MHQNYYYLKKLAPQLHEKLTDKFLSETFSQEKDELILVFSDEKSVDSLVNPFFIKATLRSNFACLSFPDKFDRARRNSVNLFAGFCGIRIVSVRVFLNERALEIKFESGAALVLKLYGNRSNLIGFDTDQKVCEVFNNKLADDYALEIGNFDRPIDQTFGAYVQNGGRHEVLFPTFGKLINTHLNKLLSGVSVDESRWAIIQSVLAELNTDKFYVAKNEMVPILSLFMIGELIDTYSTPMEALNAFYYAYIRQSGIEREKAEIIRILNKRLQQTDNYLENTFKKLVELEEGVRNDEIANILMANLHQIPARSESIELFDFYRDQPIRIKLKKDLTPQKNAEGYYRKSKNEKIETDRLNESLNAREEEKLKIEDHLAAIEKIELLRDLRTYIKVNGLNGNTNLGATAAAAALFKKVEFMGYTILIGRNAKNNDLLTKQYAFKEDLWLHARDVTGSHVVIKNQPGKKFPSPVIERAAELAAYYSKRKNDSLCPVIVTPKKYVRKLKGMPEGAVIVDKEEVVMVVAKGE